MSRTNYVIEYDRTFTFPVSGDELWATMMRLDCYPSWCVWLRDFSVEGVGLEAGSELHGVVVTPLPYRLRLVVALHEAVPARFISAFVHGDLEGTARLTFEEIGPPTHVRVTWTLEMMQRPMRLAARIGYPLLRWGHDRVVDAAVDGFRRHLSDNSAR